MANAIRLKNPEAIESFLNPHEQEKKVRFIDFVISLVFPACLFISIISMEDMAFRNEETVNCVTEENSSVCLF